ncbi:MAG: hypothetical protein HQ483_09685 [Rhodospirillales bacterium]|nr:hypothetical protein [Rhodospirillales bacterium]
MARRSVIGKSKPYERKNRRVEVPAINLELLGGRYQTLDWGLGGFRIDDFKAPIKKDQEFLVEGIGPADEDDLLAVRIPCRAVRRNKYELSCAFIVLGTSAYDILEALMLRRQKVLDKLMKGKNP